MEDLIMKNEMDELGAFYLLLYCGLNIYMKERLEEIIEIENYSFCKNELITAIKNINERIIILTPDFDQQGLMENEVYLLTEVPEFAFTWLRENEKDSTKILYNLFVFLETVELQLVGFIQLLIRLERLNIINTIQFMPRHRKLDIMEYLETELLLQMGDR
ncbi:MAG: hypothetical protein M3O71_28245 [Bacteroidota bacterium]|nr:hypothetical protein [Bacteroidota bacterium]